MELSIIILNYKQKGLVREALKNLRTLNLPFKHEIIVIDNASNDNCVKMVKEEFPEVRLIEIKKNVGYTAGNNLGIKAAKGKYILILNPDVFVLENSIEKLYNFMEKNKDVAVVAPKLINPDGTVQPSCCRFPTVLIPLYRRTILGKLPFAQKALREYLMLDWDHKENREVDWLFGASLMVRKEAIEKVGLMDERFFLYFQDIDWCRSFKKGGYKVYYLAEAEMVHLYQRLSASHPLAGFFSKITWIHILDGIKYFWKWRKSN